jgi:hypothetical protein
LIALVALFLVAFAVVSALLARIWSGDGAEQSAVTELVKDEARGDAAAVIKAVKGCAGNAVCRARATANAATLKRPGHVSVLQYTPSTGFSLGSTLGTARIAWEVVDETRPIVQCVRVRRAGDVFSGITIELLNVSKRISSDADCPTRF